MSGHSKWSKVKHQKESTDALKGKIFTKMASAIIIAVKEGGSDDASTNFKLRLAIEKAKSVNMPKENIQRAIEKARKGASGEGMSQIVYEAFGPAGVGMLIKSVTDNKQRTVSELKNLLERKGAVLATSGAVSHMFNTVGMIEVNLGLQKADAILEKVIEAGASDFEESEGRLIVYTNPTDLHRVREALDKEGLEINALELTFKPQVNITVSESDMPKISEIINNLEDREDVLKVYSNFQQNSNV